LRGFNLLKNKSDMSLMPKVIFTSLVVLMISSGMIILPSYAFPSGIPIPVPQILSAPTGLKATGASSNSIQLSWNAVPTATSYNILRQAPTGGFASIGHSTTTSYLDQVVGNQCYEVSAYGPHGAGYGSTMACARTLSTTTPTTTPTTQDTYITKTTPNGSACITNNQCQSGICSSTTHVCTSSSTSPTAPLTTTVTPPNPACLAVKTILTNSGYSVTVIATVMAAMNCS
jgi:hypothetical protein